MLRDLGMRNLWTYLVPLLLVVSASPHAVELVPTVADSRLRTDEQVGIYWLNNDEVLYIGFRESELKLIEKGALSLKDMFTTPRMMRSYNVRTKEFKDLAETGQGGFCYSRSGNVAYSRPGGREYVFGPLGKEQPFSGRFDPIGVRCVLVDPAQLPFKPLGSVVSLMEEHGYLEVRPKDAGEPATTSARIFLHSPNSTKPIEFQGQGERDAL